MFRRPPLTLYRYILSEVFVPFSGALIFFVFVLLMFQIINLVDFFVVHKVSGFWILQLLSYMTLSLMQPAIPIAFLLAVLLGFGRLSTDGEIMAMRAAGLSLFELLKPVLLMSFGLFCFCSALNSYLVPWGTKMFRYELFRISNTKVMATLHQGTFQEGFFDLMLYADEVDPKGNNLSRVFIYDSRDEANPTTVTATRGQIVPNQFGEDGSPGVILRLFDGKMFKPSISQSLMEVIDFKVYDIFLMLATAKVVGVERPMTMDAGELRRKIREMNRKENKVWEDQREINRLKMELWTRFSFAFACVVFAIMGTAFGIIRTRSARSNSLIICLGVMLVYWQVRTMCLKYGEDGYIPPFLAVEVANILLLIIALWAFRRQE